MTEKPWYRLLWSTSSALNFLGLISWGMIVIAPVALVVLGIGALAGVDDESGQAFLLAFATLFCGWCFGYVIGHESAVDDANVVISRVRGEAGSTHHQAVAVVEKDLVAMEEEAETQRRIAAETLTGFAEQIRTSVSSCVVCGGTTVAIYRGGGQICGVCTDCDELIASGYQESLIPRASGVIAYRTGNEPKDPLVVERARCTARPFVDLTLERAPEQTSERILYGDVS